MNGSAENYDVAQAVNYAPTSAKSFDDFVTEKKGYKSYASDYGFIGDIYNWGTGQRSEMEKEYDSYLQNLNASNAAKATELAYQRELKATQDARAWDKYLSDTQYQRAVKDLKAAGLNPWLALQNGVSGSTVPNSGKASALVGKSSQYERKQKEKASAGMRDISLLLFAIARLAAI